MQNAYWVQPSTDSRIGVSQTQISVDEVPERERSALGSRFLQHSIFRTHRLARLGEILFGWSDLGGRFGRRLGGCCLSGHWLGCWKLRGDRLACRSGLLENCRRRLLLLLFLRLLLGFLGACVLILLLRR